MPRLPSVGRMKVASRRERCQNKNTRPRGFREKILSRVESAMDRVEDEGSGFESQSTSLYRKLFLYGKFRKLQTSLDSQCCVRSLRPRSNETNPSISTYSAAGNINNSPSTFKS